MSMERPARMVHVPPNVRVLAMDVHANSISTGLLERDLGRTAGERGWDDSA